MLCRVNVMAVVLLYVFFTETENIDARECTL